MIYSVYLRGAIVQRWAAIMAPKWFNLLLDGSLLNGGHEANALNPVAAAKVGKAVA